jgi:hypothetical protein
VGDGKDKDGKSQTKKVKVKISYKAGVFSIGQTAGKNTMEVCSIMGLANPELAWLL